MSLALPRESVAIYCRLSRDDGQEKESSSISSQKELLQGYCAKNNLNIYKTYVDDGYTGTNFERPSFKDMIQDIKDKKVNIVITKDLSRLGRNYILTGYYTDYFFPENNVRYIALNDNIDTKTDDNAGLDFAPFKNVINEWYAKDISKKIRATIAMKQKNGEIRRPGQPLYGYKYDPSGKSIEIDEEAASNVRLIFNEYAKGTAITRICKILKENKQYAPGYYYYLKYGHRQEKYNNFNEEQKFTWSDATIKRILEYKEYLGYHITYKRTKVSFKTKKIVNIPEDERYFFENKRPQIISQELFDLVSKRRNTKIKINETSKESALHGILQCECGHYLRYRSEQNYKTFKRKPYYYCCVKQNKKQIYHININEEDVLSLIKIELEKVKMFVIEEKDKILEYASNYKEHQNQDEEYIIEQSLTQIDSKINKVNYQIEKLFEEHINDLMPTNIYQSLMNKYSSKKESLEIERLNILKKLTPKINKKIDYLSIAKTFIETIENMDLETQIVKQTLNLIFKSIVIKKLKGDGKNTYQIEYNYYLPEGMIKKYEDIFNQEH